jgi:uncharacterized membrane protein (UPF0127 family)
MKLILLAAVLASLASPALADIPPSPRDKRGFAPDEPAACVPQKAPKTTKLSFPGGKSIKADVVDTEETREKGLMCVTRMRRDYGMLFVFAKDQYLNFWMKNTLVPLDIVFIGPDKKITRVAEKLPASTTETPDDKVATAAGPGQFVLELAAGEAARRKLKAGDQLKFTAAIPAK